MWQNILKNIEKNGYDIKIIFNKTYNEKYINIKKAKSEKEIYFHLNIYNWYYDEKTLKTN